MKSNKDSGPGFATLVPKQKRILIIDDEEDVTLSLHVALEHKGFKVYSYTDPEFAYKNFRDDLYDLVLLDIMMPVVDGFHLFRKIRKRDRRVKICFLSASEYVHERFRKENGLDGFTQESFFKKPIEIDDLVLAIDKLL
ncbi:MAG TPA: response regulator [Nitrososphaeraceae archaeon]